MPAPINFTITWTLRTPTHGECVQGIKEYEHRKLLIKLYAWVLLWQRHKGCRDLVFIWINANMIGHVICICWLYRCWHRWNCVSSVFLRIWHKFMIFSVKVWHVFIDNLKVFNIWIHVEIIGIQDKDCLIKLRRHLI